jgi:predicted CDP-diglyceride synthetase/phosphatidate cytidylyltransferase
MSLFRKIAVVCGVVGGVWAVATAVFVAFFLVPAGMAWWYYATLGFLALMGAVSVAAVTLRSKWSRSAKALIWIAALALMLTSLWVDKYVLGIIFTPAWVFLILSAIGLRPSPSERSVDIQ